MLIKPIKAEKTDIFAAHNYTVVPRAHHYPGRVKETHCHAMHEIAVIHQGACQLTLAEHSGRLPVHTAFFVPKGVDHSFVADPTEGFECHLVQFDELAPGLLHELRTVSPSYVFHLSKMDFHRFTHLFYQIQREVTTNSPYTTWQCQTLIEQIVILFLRSCRKTQTNNLSLDQQQAIEQALTFLHEHATDDLTISAVAHHVGLSPVYFRRLFHAYVGINPKHYLLNLRLQNAQFMLLQENRSITEIAMLSGFGSPQQFSKSFRQTIGLTPSEWRDPSRVKLGHNGSG